MATLTFIRTREKLRAAAEEAPEGAKPFLLEQAADIPAAIEALAAGRDTLALAQSVSVGWRAPEGTVVKLHDDMHEDGLGALRHQCEGRVHRARMPVSVVTLDASAGLDGYVARLVERKRSTAEADRGASKPEAAVSDYGALLAALESAPRKSDFLRHYREAKAALQPRGEEEMPVPSMDI